MSNIILNDLEELKKDNYSGASELISKAINIIKKYLDMRSSEEKEFKKEILELSKEIINTRPSMAPLINSIGYFIGDLDIVSREKILDNLNKLSQKRKEKIISLKLTSTLYLKSCISQKSSSCYYHIAQLLMKSFLLTFRKTLSSTLWNHAPS